MQICKISRGICTSRDTIYPTLAQACLVGQNLAGGYFVIVRDTFVYYVQFWLRINIYVSSYMIQSIGSTRTILKKKPNTTLYLPTEGGTSESQV